MKVQPVITGDRSHTLFVPRLKEHYHSVFGAIRESRHVFIGAGFNCLAGKKTPVRLLEIGFGTGLNALLTYFEALKNNRAVQYTALEAFPLEPGIVQRLNYPELLDEPDAARIFLELHERPWNRAVRLSGSFTLEKRWEKLEISVLPKGSFDLVYFDAFGPVVQPELWTPEIFEKLYRALDGGSILVTYSSKGEVRRAMKEAGFSVKKLPGPAGKREMTRALKP